MKTKETNLTNVEVADITPTQDVETLGHTAAFGAGIPARYGPDSMAFSWHFTALLAAVYFTFVPLTIANGNSGGHNSGMGQQGNGRPNEHCRYAGPLWGPPYQVGIYDSDYWYTPTPAQRTKAKEEVEAYLRAVNKGRKHAATHRYISVETLRPTKTQLEDFTRKQTPARRVEPDQLRCLMVFDTHAREFVGSGCYVVSNKPLVGEVAHFETVSAEFVGHETL